MICEASNPDREVYVTNRLFVSIGAPALVTAVVFLGPAIVVGQTPASQAKPAAAKSYTAPRAADGHADLQGIWSNASLTPLERPKGLGAKEFYTPEEYAANEKKAAERLAVNEEEGRQTQPGTAEDVHYDFSQFGLDPAQAKRAPNLRTSLIVGAEGTVPSLIPEARKRAADLNAQNRGHQFDGPENRPLSARCIVLGAESVPMLSGGYNNNLQILQGQGYVAIMHEMNHSVRVIPTDGQPHAPANIRQWRGDSRGHWEGDTLVVDTTNFAAGNPFRGSGEKLHVTERFTRTDADTVLYRFTVEDPETWDKPWSAEIPWTKQSGLIYEFACHEGNYGLANTLHGARVDEEEAAAAKKSGGK
jgi:hypothetical protein